MNRSNLQVYLGNSRYIAFRLRKTGMVGFWNVSSYPSIEIEYRRVGDDAVLTPVGCSKLAPGSDWSTGLVQALITPLDVTARVGTYEYSVTLRSSPLEQTAGAGRLEVLDRPVSLYSSPTGASWASTNLMSYVNASGSTIYAGQPVRYVAGGVTLADGSVATEIADGVCVADSASSTMCLFINNGQLTLPDWTRVFGSASLPTGSDIYLGSVLGTLTAAVPTLPDFALLQIIGETASDAQTLSIAPDYTVVL